MPSESDLNISTNGGDNFISTQSSLLRVLALLFLNSRSFSSSLLRAIKVTAVNCCFFRAIFAGVSLEPFLLVANLSELRTATIWPVTFSTVAFAEGFVESKGTMPDKSDTLLLYRVAS